MTAARPKVMTVLGTRPEIIPLSRAIPAFDAPTDHALVIFSCTDYVRRTAWREAI